MLRIYDPNAFCNWLLKVNLSFHCQKTEMPNYFHFLFFPHNCNCNFSFRISFKTNYQIMSLPADKLIYFAPCTQN